jgi:hypothetical protein
MYFKLISRFAAFALSVPFMNILVAPAATAASPTAINLGSSTNFAVLASTYITTGAPSTFSGDIGAGAAITSGANNTINGTLDAGAAITTGAGTFINGNIYAGAAITLGASTTIAGSQTPAYPSPTAYSAAMTSLNSAMTYASGLTATPISTELGGSTLLPGVYSPPTFFTLTGTLTLDAQNNPNAVFILKSPGYIVTAANSSVVLANGAQAGNVFWVTGSYFSAGAGTGLSGNILGTGYVTLGAGAAVQGRIFSQTGYVLFGAGGVSSNFGLPGIGTTATPTTGTTVVAASAAKTTISAGPTTIVANGTSTSPITVQAKDANGNNLTSSGGRVTLATTLGTPSAVTDNNNGTYSATLTSSTMGIAIITGTIGGAAIAPTMVTFATPNSGWDAGTAPIVVTHVGNGRVRVGTAGTKTLVAIPHPGYFARWTGACVGVSRTCTVDTAKVNHVHVVFAPVLTLPTFYFATNQSSVVLSPKVKAQLVADLKRLVRMGVRVINVSAFADLRSSANYNRWLSSQRSEAVARYITQIIRQVGIATIAVRARGLGVTVASANLQLDRKAVATF